MVMEYYRYLALEIENRDETKEKVDFLKLIIEAKKREAYKKGQRDLYNHYFKGMKNPMIVERRDRKIRNLNEETFPEPSKSEANHSSQEVQHQSDKSVSPLEPCDVDSVRQPVDTSKSKESQIADELNKDYENENN